MMKKAILAFAAVMTLAYSCSCSNEEEVREDRYLASNQTEVEIYVYQDDFFEAIATTPRGSRVTAILSSAKKHEGIEYVPVKADFTLAKIPREIKCDGALYIKGDNLVGSRTECVQEKYVYVRTPASVVADSSKIMGFGAKGDSLLVVGVDTLMSDGSVGKYKVKLLGRQSTKHNKVSGRSSEGWIYSRYVCLDRKEARKKFDAPYISEHKEIRNPFGGGKASECDFYPVEKPSFEGNPLKECAYALYLNANYGILRNFESYIALAKETKINTFVVDIMDNENPGYKADAMKHYSPTNYSRAGKGQDQVYKKIVARLHEEGFYVVGRITCFKDTYFTKDHPECALADKATGEAIFHNKARWPSAFDRLIWEFKVALAKEAVEKFGFDEINFDYVRFPDRISGIVDQIDFHNSFNESRIQAIQNFVRYACDEIHEVGAYVSIDVFGETANKGYTTEYGQYWPAISNVADVISGMPYPDHFTDKTYGISKPWNHPYETLKGWGKRVMDRQKSIPTPAVVRTWIQAYDVMKHVDKNGIEYNAENVAKEIQGLFDAGLTGGFITWHASSKISKYRAQSAAFNKDYTNGK
ncbi:MAG: hypothetical protein HUJ95_01670 [Bacteroidales bacterium]|nr:hypothetical protein [Bacteroidales bacterium]